MTSRRAVPPALLAAILFVAIGGVRETVATHGSHIVYAEGGAVVLWGLSDVVAVHTADVTLVMRRDLAPDLKRLLDRLPDHLRQAPTKR